MILFPTGRAMAVLRRLRLSLIHIFYRDFQDKDSLISEMTIDEAQEFVSSGTLGGGMLPKLQNCIDAMKQGVSRVHIMDGRIPHCLLLEIFTNKGIGTAIINAGDERYYHGE